MVTVRRIVVKAVSSTVMPKQNAVNSRQMQDKLAPFTFAAQSLVSAVQLASSAKKVANPTVISQNRQAIHQMFRNEWLDTGRRGIPTIHAVLWGLERFLLTI